jgi:hypothetical protein
MVHKDAFINKIRELGYTYKSQQKRTQLWRKRGGTHRMFVPLCDLLEDDYVKCSLRQAGCPEPEIEAFLAIAKA